MADVAPRTELLELSSDFPAISTDAWEAAIRNDLDGGDYEQTLVWRTEEGIAVRPYYRREHTLALGELAELAPGESPFTRGTGQPWQEAQTWVVPANAVRADYSHEAGATTVQELAFALAEGVEKLQRAVDTGNTVTTAAPATVFVYAVGSNYFFEIAKLRAARTLWSVAVSAFGSEDPKAAMARIHVRTARANKSILDPYTNLLRVTTEAMSAVLGGCDSLSIEAFGFDSHLALNVQRILREEGQLAHVADAAGGAYYIEALTDVLARDAWKLFQQVEATGSWTAALNSGFVERELTKAREAKAKAIAARRRTLVGVNKYPNTAEKKLENVAPAPFPGDPLPQTRFAEPFERIRLRTAGHAKATGTYPKVLLLKRGDLRMKMTRANFCLNFFGCAGFDIAESEEYAGSEADLIVVCSSDPEYLPFAKEVCAAVSVPVLVAGNPKDQVPELEAVGVKGFVHMLSNAVETLTHWQNQLGIGEVPEHGQ